MTWIPPYAIEECQAVVEADFGECDAEDVLTRADPTLFLTLSRQIIFLIPLVLMLPFVMGLSGVFAAFPVADVLATAVTVIMLVREFKRLKGLELESAAA